MLALLRTRRRRCRGGILDYRWAAFWKSLGRPGRMADSTCPRSAIASIGTGSHIFGNISRANKPIYVGVVHEPKKLCME